ncbi:hypothetical protein [Streptomyces phaeolivaceus]|uniref:hypothetical protein n=1 Tax=Streptomyces phaeolivaceus TaxID=2653200 RepID=UPI001D04BE1E|nr:hypothetical protein [Streptomyces phaeolivaceus]
MPHTEDAGPTSPPAVLAPAEPEPSNDRDLSAHVRSWLLAAAFEPEKAREQWAHGGLALIGCGGLLSTVRISTTLVYAAADTNITRDVDAFLSEALQNHPVFMDRHARWYYVLVPSSARRRPEWRSTGPRHGSDIEFLGMGSYVGVPRPEAIDPDAERSYWCVPVRVPGALADPDTVHQFLTFAVRRRAQAAEMPTVAHEDAHRSRHVPPGPAPERLLTPHSTIREGELSWSRPCTCPTRSSSS